MRYGLLAMALAGLLAGAPSLDSILPIASAMQDNPLPAADSAVSPGFHPLAQKTKLNTDLPSVRHSIGFDPAQIAYEMRPVDARELEKTASHQVGIGRALGISSETHGRVFSTKDGSAIRILAIKSPDAVAIRVHFEQFNIPPGNEVYVYGLASDSHVAGPYTLQGPFGRSKESPVGGEFWTDTIQGDTVIIEHYMKDGEANLYISEISHFYRSVPGNDLAPNVLA
ncbi:MAG TPA: hypothetical protein VFQ92_02030 [Blastocatellia bacterium]|nr:hypothetical protein [Blastocatellia bacterium]